MIDDPLKLLIRADAGPHSGTRHVQRMITLGRSWSRFGDVAFVHGVLPDSLARKIKQQGFQVHEIPNSHADAHDVSDTCEIADSFEPDWIALDGPRFDNSYQRLIAQQPARMLVVDDANHGYHQDADLVLRDSPDQPFCCPDHSTDLFQLTGPEFALVQSALPGEKKASKHIFAQARRILVAFSGPDVENHALRVLQLLSDIAQSRMMVDCVIDSDFLHRKKLDEFKRETNMNLRIHRNSDRMLTLLQHADLSITDGNSCYLAAHCGVPAIVVKSGANQRLSATTLDESGTMISLADLPGIKVPRTCETNILPHRLIRRLVNNSNLRKQMSDLGKQLVDGFGADRVARKMVTQCLSFRIACQHDAPQLCVWQNDPEVRSVSFDTKPTAKAANRDSFNKKISDGKTRLWIVEDRESRPVGQVQIVAEHDGTANISLIVDQARRGQGLGTVLIEHAVEQAFQEASIQRVLAQVRPINVASEKAFKNAGFQPTQPTTVAGKLANQYVFERNWLRHVAPISQDLRKTA